jgi:alpha-D-ribose 1-methylphosphonate 5-triphosphate synthase subunit PhnL
LLRRAKSAVDIATAEPRTVLALRKNAIGYVSQFLRAVPRVATIDVVAEPLVAGGAARDEARGQAAEILSRLNISKRLWDLPPATFSGGEQQRVNIARGFLPDFPVLLLDEPTASLDAANRAVVVELIAAKKKSGTAIVAIAHDHEVRAALADQIVDIQKFAAAA